MSALLEGARAVLAYRDFEQAARAIFDACKNLLGARAGYVALLTDDGTENEVVFLEPGGLPCSVDPSLPMPIRGLRETAYREGIPVYDNDFARSQWAKLLPDGHVGLDSVLFAPLVVKGIAVGLLGLANKPGGFDEHDAHLASAFGELASIALFNSRTLKWLETSEERFRSVAVSASAAIITTDSQGAIVFWNRAAESIFGYTADEAMGKPLTFLMPERSQAIHRQELGRMVSTRRPAAPRKAVEMVGLRKRGDEFAMDASYSTWETQEGTFFTHIIRDITERKKAAQALQERTREMAAMQERQRLARDLHDAVSQTLFSACLSAEVLPRLWERDRADAQRCLQDVHQLTRSALAEMRTLLLELRPGALAETPLGDLLNQLAEAVAWRARLPVSLQTDPAGPLPPDVQVTLYRITQEALNNVIKHARASRAEVRLRCVPLAGSVPGSEQPTGLELCIRDDGCGFDLEEASTRHLGLRIMRERAEAIGAELRIESRDGLGSQVLVAWPGSEGKDTS